MRDYAFEQSVRDEIAKLEMLIAKYGPDKGWLMYTTGFSSEKIDELGGIE